MKNNIKNITLIILIVGITLSIITISYSYLKPIVDNIEDISTIKLDGAEIYANYTSTSTLYIEDIEPSNNIIGYKDFSLEVKNTSSKEVSAYIYLDIIYSDYTDIENDGVLYYELVSDGTTIVDKTMIKAIKSGKALLYELVLPSHTSSTIINYRLNIYFPESDKIQNLNKGEDGTMKFNAKIEIMNESLSLKNYISKLNMEENGLEYDDFGNLRYVGASPNNYITFNNETWRIIGIVDGYVKIIKDERMENYYWDSKGYNNWSKASLKEYLNNEYYNSLNETSQLCIQETTWKLVVMPDNFSKEMPENYDIKYVYNQERGNEVYSGKTTEWFGKITLMYASDFGYASTDTECRGDLQSVYYYNFYDQYDNLWKLDKGYCSNSNWLNIYIPPINITENSIELFTGEFLLNPSSTTNVFAFRIDSGYLSTLNNHVDEKNYIRPSLHLTNETTRISGTGTSLDPYIIG